MRQHMSVAASGATPLATLDGTAIGRPGAATAQLRGMGWRSLMPEKEPRGTKRSAIVRGASAWHEPGVDKPK
jgi:hypothetical protein